MLSTLIKMPINLFNYAVIQSAEHCKQSCRYWSGASVNVYIKHQNMEKSAISVTLTVVWMLAPDGLG